MRRTTGALVAAILAGYFIRTLGEAVEPIRQVAPLLLIAALIAIDRWLDPPSGPKSPDDVWRKAVDE